MANLNQWNQSLNTARPQQDQPPRNDIAGLAAAFTDSPTDIQNKLSYDWNDMHMEVNIKNREISSQLPTVRAEIHIGLDSWEPVTPTALGERAAILVTELAQRTGDLSGALKLISFGYAPEIVTESVLDKFDSTRTGIPDQDDANIVASIDSPLLDKGEDSEVLFVTDPSEFEVIVYVDRLEKLPEIWKDIAIRLGLINS